MNTQLYFITANTHLHVGSGNSNAGVIDNLIQRDPADNLPCIFASSLKGAFREYFEEGPSKSVTELIADQIFGAGVNKKSNAENSKGSHVFHQASLLSIPARSNQKPFFNATSPSILNKYMEETALFGIDGSGLASEIKLLLNGNNADGKVDVIGPTANDLKIEDYTEFNFRAVAVPNILKAFGNELIIMSDEDFADLCSDYNLPVIARNNLENGQSKNLWYEQIVPRQARFYFFTACNQGTDNFDLHVNKQYVQIGANASIGYGLCTIKNLKTQLS